jgi:uncharacterized membrane protein
MGLLAAAWGSPRGSEPGPELGRVGVVGVGLVGGALFAFSVFIMAALRQLPDGEGMRAMQSINRTVYTPWFMGPFFGTALLSLGAVVFGGMKASEPWGLAFAAAGVLYVAGVFVVTAVGNVPMNKRLDALDPDDPEAAEYWNRYIVVWTRWNHLRSLASAGSALLFVESIRLAG